MKKHFISVMAVILIFTLLLTACGEPTPKTSSENPSTAGATSTAPMTTTEPEEVPDIPDPSEVDFNGQELNVLVWKLAARNNSTCFVNNTDSSINGIFH